MDQLRGICILFELGLHVGDVGAITTPPLIEILRHHGLQTMLSPEKEIVYDTAELNCIPDLGDVALPNSYHFLDAR
jgi:hypothetical protein